MKILHYRNIGFPKTGTTWLHTQFLYHPNIDCKPDLNDKEYIGNNKEDYIRKYERFNISYNLYTHLFREPNKLYYYTHLTFTLRNIYDLLNSYYNYIKNTNTNAKLNEESYLNLNDSNFLMFTDIEKIFEDWKEHNIKFLFYDDLVTDSKKYLYDICDYLNIPRYFDKRFIKPVFKTSIKEQLKFEDEKIVAKVNHAITIIEDKTQRDLSHWKK